LPRNGEFKIFNLELNIVGKFFLFIAIIISTALIAGMYGVLHDQITYSISPEYFTKFKYDQFGFEPSWFGGHRQTVAVIGFLATWWIGVFIGIVIAIGTLFNSSPVLMFRTAIKSITIVMVTTVLTGVVGALYGAISNHDTLQWYFPDDLTDKYHFIIVGWIHNFGYLGGLCGLVAAILFQIYDLVRQKRSIAKVCKTAGSKSDC
jgi:hypothetical protein